MTVEVQYAISEGRVGRNEHMSILSRHHRLFESLLILSDAATAGAAFLLARQLRFSFPETLPFGEVSPSVETFWLSLLAMLIWPLLARLGGLYRSRRTEKNLNEAFQIIKTSVGALIALVTVAYFTRDHRYSRLTLLIWACLTPMMVFSGRVVLRFGLSRLRKMGLNLRHIIVVGDGEAAKHIIETIRGEPALGLNLIGHVGEAPAHRDVPFLGGFDDLERVADEHLPQQWILALRPEKMPMLASLVEVMQKTNADIRLIPDVIQYATLGRGVEDFSGFPCIDLQSTPQGGLNLLLKRSFDLIVGGFLTVVGAPLMGLLAATVKLTSRGPVLYAQERVGMDGRPFKMLKFRSMVGSAEAAGAQMAQHNDPRCTLVGRWMRRFSLDELPQLFNVLKGEMSLVGPRPERPCFIEGFKEEIPGYALRHKAKAGMTGLAQVRGLRGETSMTRRIEVDLYYIEHWSLWLDLQILLRTVFGGFHSKHAG